MQVLEETPSHFTLLCTCDGAQKSLGMAVRQDGQITAVGPNSWAEQMGIKIHDELLFEEKQTYQEMLMRLKLERPLALKLKRIKFAGEVYEVVCAERKLGFRYYHGVVVEVKPDSWAGAVAGILPGDKLLEIQDLDCTRPGVTADDMLAALRQPRPTRLLLQRPKSMDDAIADMAAQMVQMEAEKQADMMNTKAKAVSANTPEPEVAAHQPQLQVLNLTDPVAPAAPTNRRSIAASGKNFTRPTLEEIRGSTAPGLPASGGEAANNNRSRTPSTASNSSPKKDVNIRWPEDLQPGQQLHLHTGNTPISSRSGSLGNSSALEPVAEENEVEVERTVLAEDNGLGVYQTKSKTNPLHQNAKLTSTPSSSSSQTLKLEPVFEENEQATHFHKDFDFTSPTSSGSLKGEDWPEDLLVRSRSSQSGRGFSSPSALAPVLEERLEDLAKEQDDDEENEFAVEEYPNSTSDNNTTPGRKPSPRDPRGPSDANVQAAVAAARDIYSLDDRGAPEEDLNIVLAINERESEKRGPSETDLALAINLAEQIQKMESAVGELSARSDRPLGDEPRAGNQSSVVTLPRDSASQDTERTSGQTEIMLPRDSAELGVRQTEVGLPRESVDDDQPDTEMLAKETAPRSSKKITQLHTSKRASVVLAPGESLTGGTRDKDSLAHKGRQSVPSVNFYNDNLGTSSSSPSTTETGNKRSNRRMSLPAGTVGPERGRSLLELGKQEVSDGGTTFDEKDFDVNSIMAEAQSMKKAYEKNAAGVVLDKSKTTKPAAPTQSATKEDVDSRYQFAEKTTLISPEAKARDDKKMMSQLSVPGGSAAAAGGAAISPRGTGKSLVGTTLPGTPASPRAPDGSKVGDRSPKASPRPSAAPSSSAMKTAQNTTTSPDVLSVAAETRPEDSSSASAAAAQTSKIKTRDDVILQKAKLQHQGSMKIPEENHGELVQHFHTTRLHLKLKNNKHEVFEDDFDTPHPNFEAPGGASSTSAQKKNLSAAARIDLHEKEILNTNDFKSTSKPEGEQQGGGIGGLDAQGGDTSDEQNTASTAATTPAKTVNLIDAHHPPRRSEGHETDIPRMHPDELHSSSAEERVVEENPSTTAGAAGQKQIQMNTFMYYPEQEDDKDSDVDEKIWRPTGKNSVNSNYGTTSNPSVIVTKTTSPSTYQASVEKPFEQHFLLEHGKEVLTGRVFQAAINNGGDTGSPSALPAAVPVNYVGGLELHKNDHADEIMGSYGSSTFSPAMKEQMKNEAALMKQEVAQLLLGGSSAAGSAAPMLKNDDFDTRSVEIKKESADDQASTFKRVSIGETETITPSSTSTEMNQQGQSMDAVTTYILYVLKCLNPCTCFQDGSPAEADKKNKAAGGAGGQSQLYPGEKKKLVRLRPNRSKSENNLEDKEKDKENDVDKENETMSTNKTADAATGAAGPPVVNLNELTDEVKNEKIIPTIQDNSSKSSNPVMKADRFWHSVSGNELGKMVDAFRKENQNHDRVQRGTSSPLFPASSPLLQKPKMADASTQVFVQYVDRVNGAVIPGTPRLMSARSPRPTPRTANRVVKENEKRTYNRVRGTSGIVRTHGFLGMDLRVGGSKTIMPEAAGGVDGAVLAQENSGNGKMYVSKLRTPRSPTSLLNLSKIRTAGLRPSSSKAKRLSVGVLPVVKEQSGVLPPMQPVTLLGVKENALIPANRIAKQQEQQEQPQFVPHMHENHEVTHLYDSDPTNPNALFEYTKARKDGVMSVPAPVRFEAPKVNSEAFRAAAAERTAKSVEQMREKTRVLLSGSSTPAPSPTGTVEMNLLFEGETTATPNSGSTQHSSAGVAANKAEQGAPQAAVADQETTVARSSLMSFFYRPTSQL
ncbi:unnamed protein product [Amoebophrya sp. A120]|nr:unnamed protein product [Amoebophrya sp. A120]|eukprot:GSA120T00000658001.1